MFTTAEFLQQHIVRKHAQHARSASTKDGEEKTALPAQLRLFVQVMRILKKVAEISYID